MGVIFYGIIFIAMYFVAKWLRDYMQGGTYKKNNRIDGKIVIITGANCGIGRVTACELANRGAIVYMACRDMKKAEEARFEIVQTTGNKNVFCRALDLASLDSVRDFVENTRHQVASWWYRVYFFGKINKDDLNSVQNYSKAKAYGQSKLANVLFARELAKRLEGTGVTVNSLHPGSVKTELGRHLNFFKNPFISFLVKPIFWLLIKTVESGAQTTLYAALDPDLERVSGMYFSDCKFKEVATAAKDNEMAKWLWAESEKWTKIKT